MIIHNWGIHLELPPVTIRYDPLVRDTHYQWGNSKGLEVTSQELGPRLNLSFLVDSKFFTTKSLHRLLNVVNLIIDK